VVALLLLLVVEAVAVAAASGLLLLCLAMVSFHEGRTRGDEQARRLFPRVAWRTLLLECCLPTKARVETDEPHGSSRQQRAMPHNDQRSCNRKRPGLVPHGRLFVMAFSSPGNWKQAESFQEAEDKRSSSCACLFAFLGVQAKRRQPPTTGSAEQGRRQPTRLTEFMTRVASKTSPDRAIRATTTQQHLDLGCIFCRNERTSYDGCLVLVDQ
jgi:hypothetical protein